MRYAVLPAALLVAASLAGCQHRPTITYPKLIEAGSIEGAFDCPALDDAILKTEAVRWVMRADGARLLTPEERGGRIATELVTDIAAQAVCFLCLSPVHLGDEGHAALHRADGRLLSLLKLKKAKGCAPGSTGIAALTDLDLYDAVDALIAQELQKPPSKRIGELQAERTRLLDGLRP